MGGSRGRRWVSGQTSSPLPARDAFVAANGLRFHYLEWGDAASPPLILLHGFGNEAHIWDLFAPVVAGRYRVLAFDARGHGDSDRAAEYGARANAADLEALAAALKLDPLSLVGFSMGGTSATIAASNGSINVARLVLVDVGPRMNDPGSQRLRQTVGRARPLFANREEALAYIRLANPRRSEPLVEASLEHAFRRHEDGSYELKYDPKLRENVGRTMPDEEELWDRLRRIHSPTLIVHGAESELLEESTARRMVEIMADARLETVAGAGHPVMMDNPSGFNQVVSSFL
ncbi:MAG: alpha/beta hydrolase [Chloroflexota bacterium]|nr:alpha/beta hydrolase [Chloroflexota bacterium]